MTLVHLAKTTEAQKSGPLGLVLILLLCVACYFLFKSMSKHLRKVREEFPADSRRRPGPRLRSRRSRAWQRTGRKTTRPSWSARTHRSTRARAHRRTHEIRGRQP